MPHRNRATPLGELIDDPARGLVYANRGCLHDARGSIRRRYNGRRWIACRLEFNGRRRQPLMRPGRYTELFFLDEATAMAAGHRPCGECRYRDHQHFAELWRGLHPGSSGVDAIDARLQDERVDPVTRGQRRHERALDDLPDGAFILRDGTPWLVLGDELLAWTPVGYTDRAVRPRGVDAVVLTPPSFLDILQSGWGTEWRSSVPFLHPTARATGSGTPRPYPAEGGPVHRERSDIRDVVVQVCLGVGCWILASAVFRDRRLRRQVSRPVRSRG